MAILLYNNTNKDLSAWVDALKKEDDNIDLRVYPNIGNTDDIFFAITWPFEIGMFNQYKNLKAICSMGAGVNHILKDTSIKKDIQILKLVDENLIQSMWEYLLSTVMFYTSNINNYLLQQENKIYKELAPKSIKNTTIGIMGVGSIGKIVALNFKNLGFKVKAYSKNKKSIQDIQTFAHDELESFLDDVDILISILPLTMQTKNIFDKKFFLKMKKGAKFINVGRGALVVEEDLEYCINNNILSDAFLDVFRKEPLPTNHSFYTNKHIHITPHIASITNPSSVAKQIIQNYKLITNNKLALNRVDVNKGY